MSENIVSLKLWPVCGLKMRKQIAGYPAVKVKR